jgi:hypothetical protein
MEAWKQRIVDWYTSELVPSVMEPGWKHFLYYQLKQAIDDIFYLHSITNEDVFSMDETETMTKENTREVVQQLQLRRDALTTMSDSLEKAQEITSDFLVEQYVEDLLPLDVNHLFRQNPIILRQIATWWMQTPKTSKQGMEKLLARIQQEIFNVTGSEMIFPKEVELQSSIPSPFPDGVKVHVRLMWLTIMSEWEIMLPWELDSEPGTKQPFSHVLMGIHVPDREEESGGIITTPVAPRG